MEKNYWKQQTSIRRHYEQQEIDLSKKKKLILTKSISAI